MLKKLRFGFALSAAGVLSLGGCASGGGGGGGGAAEEGNPPRENSHTRSAELALTQAMALGDPTRFDAALEAASNAIAEEPTNPLGYFQAGRAQIGLEDYAAADTLFEAALELYPAYAEDVRVERENAWIVMFNNAIEPLNAGAQEEGVRMLEMAELVFPGRRPEALINLGVSYGNMGRPEDAIDAFARALAVIRGPRRETVDSATHAGWLESEASVTFNRAQLLGQVERYDEAAAEYEAYLESNPDNVSALSSLAAVMSQSGRPDSAQAIYDQLLSQSDLGPRESFNIGVGLYSAEVYDRAAEAFQAVAEVAPQNRDALYNWAQSLYEAEEWEALLPVAQDLLALDEYNSNSYQILARALINADDEQEAVRILQLGEDLAFTLEDTQLQPRSSGGGSVNGYLTNRSLEAGATVAIRVHFISDDGIVAGSADIRVTAPEPESAEPFAADLSSDESILGFYFEVLSPN